MPFTFQASGPRGPELAEMNSNENEIAESLTVGAGGTHQASCWPALLRLPPVLPSLVPLNPSSVRSVCHTEAAPVF